MYRTDARTYICICRCQETTTHVVVAGPSSRTSHQRPLPTLYFSTAPPPGRQTDGRGGENRNRDALLPKRRWKQ